MLNFVPLITYINNIYIIGTHSIDNVLVAAIEGGTVRAAVTYTPDCNAALGTLFSFTFITDSGTVDFTRSILLPVDRNSSLSSTLPIHLSPGQYQVHVYDIEQEGKLNEDHVSYPAAALEVEMPFYSIGQCKIKVSDANFIMHFYIFSGFLPIFFHLDNCSTIFSTFTFSAECTYPSNSLATGFLMLVQLGDPDQVHKLYVNQTRDQQSLVSVEVEENAYAPTKNFRKRDQIAKKEGLSLKKRDTLSLSAKL